MTARELMVRTGQVVALRLFDLAKGIDLKRVETLWARRPECVSTRTCDSADHKPGAFFLPDDVREGDWIEIGQLGAYGACLPTAFNGFDKARLVQVRNQPLLETPGDNDVLVAQAV